MVNDKVHIIMPVKNSWGTAEMAIRAIIAGGYTLTVYDDYSTRDNAQRLDFLGEELGFRVVHISQHFDHPSPNYRWVLIEAQYEALEKGRHLVIVESDVMVRKDTIERLINGIKDEKTGMVAAITVDEDDKVIFPYEYARHMKTDFVCQRRLSFCCTLLTNAFLQAYDFTQLEPKKDWYDVPISRLSRWLKFENILQVSNPVLHIPHSSRPWKYLKYTKPLLYYWRKLIYGRDKI